MKWILLQKWSRFVPFFFTPFLELNLLLENNSAQFIDRLADSKNTTWFKNNGNKGVEETKKPY